MSYIKCRKIQGKHHMYCPVNKTAVVLGKGCDDGDVAYLTPAQAKSIADNPTWKVLDGVDEEELLNEEVGEPDGLLVLVSKGGGWYDVKNTATGEVINTTSLRLEDAESIISEYKVAEEGDGDEGDEGDGDE